MQYNGSFSVLYDFDPGKGSTFVPVLLLLKKYDQQQFHCFSEHTWNHGYPENSWLGMHVENYS